MAYIRAELGGGSKPKLLGNLGGTFDLSSYPNYHNFTLANFFVKPGGLSYSGGNPPQIYVSYWDPYSASGSCGEYNISVPNLLSYNSSTGILTTTSTGSGGVHLSIYWEPNNYDGGDHEGSNVGASLTLSGQVYLVEMI